MISERFAFIDDISGPAGKARDVVRALRKELEGLGKSGGGSGSKGFGSKEALQAQKAADAGRLASLKAQNKAVLDLIRRDSELAKIEAKRAVETEKSARAAQKVAAQNARTNVLGVKGAKGGGSLTNISSNSSSLMGDVGTWAATAIGGLVSAAITKAASAAVDLVVSGTKAVASAVQFRQATERSFGVLLGSAKEAKAVYAQGLALAKELGASGKETLGGLNTLMARGFKAEGVTGALNVLRAMADLQAISPKANIENVVNAIAQIRSKGKLTLEELQGQLGEQFDVGAVIEQLSKKLGKSGDEIRKQISAGKIDAETGIQAVLDAIQAKTGKALGKAAAEASRGLGGVFGRLGNWIENTLLGIQMTPGMKKVDDFFSRLIDKLEGAQGSKVAKSFEQVVDAAAELFGVKGDVDGIDAALGMLSDTLDGVAQGLRDVKPLTDGVFSAMASLAGSTDQADGMRLFGEAIVYTTVAVAGLVGALGVLAYGVYATTVKPFVDAAEGIRAAIKAIEGIFDGEISVMSQKGASLGSALVNGLIAALTGNLFGVAAAGAQVTAAAEAGGRAESDTHSPSRKWAALARDEIAGYVGEHQRSARSLGAVGGAVTAAARPANDSGVGTMVAARGGGGGIHVGAIHASVGGGAAGDPSSSPAAARQTGEAIGEGIEAYFRRMKERTAA